MVRAHEKSIKEGGLLEEVSGRSRADGSGANKTTQKPVICIIYKVYI
jgi:hypothetical protein